MNFLAPAALIFGITLPVVVVFYLLKRKRVVKLVPSTLLWQKFLAETQANAPFQKLRHNWLLVFQLLMLALAVLALARPYFAGKTKDGGLLVVILDASASMQSTDESPSRFEKARSEALKLVASMKEDDQMVVLSAGATTEVKQSATREKSSLRRAIESAAVTDSPTRMVEAIKLAQTLIQNRANPEIHLFSDGAIPNLSDLSNKDLPVVYHKFGERGNNLGIVALDVRPNPDNAAQRAIFTSVANYSTSPQQTELELRFNGQVIDVRSIKLAPKEISPQVFVASQSKDGVFTVNITAKDDLAADNTASVVSLLPAPVKVLLVSKGNRFLEKALRAAPNVELSVSTDMPLGGKGYDVAILDDVIPLTWPVINTLAIHTASTNWFDRVSSVEAPVIVDWKSSHPLLRFLNFDNVQISESMAVKTPPWGIALVESQKTPLLVAGEIGKQRIVWVGFDTLQSTWPLRISFPIFVANAVDWLNPASINAGLLTVKSGEPFRLSLTDPVVTAQLTRPDGTVKPLTVDPKAAELVIGDTTRQGIYHLKINTNDTQFCVNLIDPAESDTTPRAELNFSKYNVVQASTQRRANLEFWRWLAGAGLFVLLFEWWYYHRRTA